MKNNKEEGGMKYDPCGHSGPRLQNYFLTLKEHCTQKKYEFIKCRIFVAINIQNLDKNG